MQGGGTNISISSRNRTTFLLEAHCLAKKRKKKPRPKFDSSTTRFQHTPAEFNLLEGTDIEISKHCPRIMRNSSGFSKVFFFWWIGYFFPSPSLPLLSLFDSRLSSLGLYKLDANSWKGYVPGICDSVREEEEEEERFFDSKAAVTHFAEGEGEKVSWPLIHWEIDVAWPESKPKPERLVNFPFLAVP